MTKSASVLRDLALRPTPGESGPADQPWSAPALLPLPPHSKIAIIGSGFSGLGAAIALSNEGYGDDLIILERRSGVGGTWHDNSYPGCRCDVPSNLYSFSFAPNPHWTETFSAQPEIERYLQRTARQFGVLGKVAFDAAVEQARWDAGDAVWRLETSRGALTADFLINGGGLLSEPFTPELPGASSFAGNDLPLGAVEPCARSDRAPGGHHRHRSLDHPVPAHRAEGGGSGHPVPAHAAVGLPPSQPPDHRPRAHGLSATALDPARLAGPQLLDGRGVAGHHAHPQQPEAAAPREAGQALPGPPGGGSRAAGQAHPDLHAGVQAAPAVERLLPGPATTQRHAWRRRRSSRCVPKEWSRPTARSIEVDTIIYGTGFRITNNPMAEKVHGADGRSLKEYWADTGMRAYCGTTIPGFPNFFMMAGPNTGIGHTSLVVMIEAQVAHIVGALRALRDRGADVVDVRPDVLERWSTEVQAKAAPTVWNSGGCSSWYLDDAGRNTTLWPDYTFRFIRRTRTFDPADYVLSPRPS